MWTWIWAIIRWILKKAIWTAVWGWIKKWLGW